MPMHESAREVIDLTSRHAGAEVETLERALSEQPFWRFSLRRAIRNELADARRRQRHALDTLADGA